MSGNPIITAIGPTKTPSPVPSESESEYETKSPGKPTAITAMGTPPPTKNLDDKLNDNPSDDDEELEPEGFGTIQIPKNVVITPITIPDISQQYKKTGITSTGVQADERTFTPTQTNLQKTPPGVDASKRKGRRPQYPKIDEDLKNANVAFFGKVRKPKSYPQISMKKVQTGEEFDEKDPDNPPPFDEKQKMRVPANVSTEEKELLDETVKSIKPLLMQSIVQAGAPIPFTSEGIMHLPSDTKKELVDSFGAYMIMYPNYVKDPQSLSLLSSAPSYKRNLIFISDSIIPPSGTPLNVSGRKVGDKLGVQPIKIQNAIQYLKSKRPPPYYYQDSNGKLIKTENSYIGFIPNSGMVVQFLKPSDIAKYTKSKFPTHNDIMDNCVKIKESFDKSITFAAKNLST